MDETLETIKNYAVYAWRGMGIQDNYQTILIWSLVILVCLLAYIGHTASYQERAARMKKKRDRTRKLWEKANDIVTKAIEDEVRKGHLKAEEAAKVYDTLRELPQFREVGPEASYGRPWYYGVAASLEPSRVKGAIVDRLRKMRVDTTAFIDKARKRRENRPSAKQQYQDSLKQLKLQRTQRSTT